MNKFHKSQEPAVESQIENECVVEFVNNLVMGEEIEIVTVDIWRMYWTFYMLSFTYFVYFAFVFCDYKNS